MASVEHNTQAACVLWFKKLQYPQFADLLINVANGARRTAWEQRQKREEGLTAGAPDLLLLMPRGGYGSLAIEMKKEVEEWKQGKRTLKRGYQSQEQKKWQANYEAAGNRYVVCHSLEEFTREINKYLNLPK